MLAPLLLIYALYASCIFLWWFFTRNNAKQKKNPIFKVTFYTTIVAVLLVGGIFLSQVVEKNLLERKLSSLPLYPGVEIVDISAHVNGDDGTFASIEYSIPASVNDNDVEDFYNKFFQSEGWNKEAKVNVSYKDIRYRAKGLSTEEQVRLQLSRDKELTKIITIVYTPK